MDNINSMIITKGKPLIFMGIIKTYIEFFIFLVLLFLIYKNFYQFTFKKIILYI